MVIGSHQKVANKSLHVSVGGNRLTQVNSVRYLGVLIDYVGSLYVYCLGTCRFVMASKIRSRLTSIACYMGHCHLQCFVYYKHCMTAMMLFGLQQLQNWTVWMTELILSSLTSCHWHTYRSGFLFTLTALHKRNLLILKIVALEIFWLYNIASYVVIAKVCICIWMCIASYCPYFHVMRNSDQIWEKPIIVMIILNRESLSMKLLFSGALCTQHT